MKRRSALAAMCAVFAGCGGGGGGGPGNEPPQQGPAQLAPAPAPAPVPSRDIAWWGDSLTAGAAPKLAPLFPERAVYNGGISGETSAQILARVLADSEHTDWVSIFWMGRNSVYTPGAQITADVAAAVAHLAQGNDHFLVLPILNEIAEPKGSAGYAKVMQINAVLAAAYPDNFLDVRARLVAAGDPSLPQDIIDQQNDIVPSSLRVDNVHLTSAGYALVADMVRQFVADQGW